jgi:transcriptional regulator with XRE-family HTH domain
MENTVAIRIKQLRAHYNLSVKEFAVKAGLSHVAIFHLENGKTLKPHRASLQRLANVFGTSADWILYGTGEMLPAGKVQIYSDDLSFINQWKEEAFIEMKQKNSLLEREVERLWQMISHFTSGVKPNLQIVMDAK